jgi:hypothetical protein
MTKNNYLIILCQIISCQKIAKSYQKVVKKDFKKLQKVDKRKCHVSLVILCVTGRDNQQRWWGWGWVGNSSSKAFGISFADRPKAISTMRTVVSGHLTIFISGAFDDGDADARGEGWL